ncbi:hypothetical protein IFM47457_11241 [Aspergillus lentulus]|nr:hypothetical protein IFM47457_11241 [Aspergillus lentulus]
MFVSTQLWMLLESDEISGIRSPPGEASHSNPTPYHPSLFASLNAIFSYPESKPEFIGPPQERGYPLKIQVRNLSSTNGIS